MSMSPYADAARMSGARRVAVITGGSQGIGRASAEALARAGLAVVLGHEGNDGTAETVARAIVDAGGEALAVRADLANEVGVNNFFDRAELAFGGIDIVLHAAGQLGLSSPSSLRSGDVSTLHRANVRSSFIVTQEAARRVRPGGTILTFSTPTVGTFPNYGAHAASDGGMRALILVLARELRGRNVTVNAITPGSPAPDRSLDSSSVKGVARLASALPLKRFNFPEDIARTVVFLTTAAGRAVNGRVLRANGSRI